MFGTRRDYTIEKGKVVYTAITKEYKDMLMFVNKLYANNLLDKEFLTLNTAQWEAKMTSGEAGSTWDVAARADMLTGAMAKVDPKAELKLLLPPKGPTGLGTYEVSQATNYYTSGVAINAKSKYVNEAFKLFDYIYGSEGADLINFGVKGETYNVENGTYKFTDKIMNEIKTGLIPQSTFAKYGIGTWNFTFPYNVQADIAIGNIGPKVADLASRLQPSDISHPVPIGRFTAKQQARIKEIEPTLTAMRDEYSAKFMNGDIAFDSWDKYVADMKKNNVEEYEQILNEGYNAYLTKLATLK
jgi:putative aldouronate transport system substrate-binding protein